MEENILKWWIANKNVLRDIQINGFVEKKNIKIHIESRIVIFFLYGYYYQTTKLRLPKPFRFNIMNVLIALNLIMILISIFLKNFKVLAKYFDKKDYSTIDINQQHRHHHHKH